MHSDNNRSGIPLTLPSLPEVERGDGTGSLPTCALLSQCAGRDDAASSGGCGLAHSVHDSFEEVAGLQAEWDRFVEERDGDLFSTFDGCRIWWKHYGDGRRLEIHLFREGERLVGVFPLFRETLRFGPVAVRLIRLVGCDHSVTTCGFAVHPDHTAQVVASLMARISHGPPWDMIHLGPLPGYFRGRDHAAAAFAGHAAVGRILSSADDGPHIVFDLPESNEAYLAGLASRERNNIKSRKRKLEKGHAVCESMASADEVSSWFDGFVAQHQRQWQAENQLGHFVDWPGSEAFHREMAATMTKSGRLRLLRLEVDGKAAGFQYNYRFGRRVHWILGSRDHDPCWDQFSLGRYLLCSTIEHAIAEGAGQLDAMRGMYHYKLQLGGALLNLQSIAVVRRGIGAELRVRSARFAARILHLAYYRVLFGRLAPRLPFLRGPLWRRWIRSRI